MMRGRKQKGGSIVRVWREGCLLLAEGEGEKHARR